MDTVAYGCLFCVTGKEERVAERIRAATPSAKAITARREKHKTVQGEKSKLTEILLPGYVFFEVPGDMQSLEWLPKMDVLRVLRYEGEGWKLRGSDREFAAWLFQYDGLLSFSKAVREGDRIRILSGPLKDMEGKIKKMDRRGRTAQVMLEFCGTVVSAWLGYDILAPKEISGGETD